MDALTRPAHMVISVAVALLVGSTIGVVAEVNDRPDTMRFGDLHIGDRAVYNLRSNDPSQPAEERSSMVVAMVSGKRVVGADGIERNTATMETSYRVQDGTDSFMRTEKSWAVSMRSHVAADGVPVAHEWGLSYETITGGYNIMYDQALACGLTSIPYGEVPPQRLALPPCIGTGSFDEPRELDLTGHLLFGLRPAVEYASHDGLLRLIFADGIPYPVQITTYREAHGALFFTTRSLAAFEAGDAPLPPPEPRVLFQTPETTEPAPDIWLDESGSDRVFSLRHAVQLAKDHERLATWLQGTDALLVRAEYREDLGEVERRTWQIQFHDGDEGRAATIHQETGARDQVGQAMETVQQERQVTYTTMVADLVGELDSLSAPTSVPRIDSMAAAMQALPGMDASADDFGFAFWEGEWRFYVGADQASSEQGARIRQQAWFDEQGQLRSASVVGDAFQVDAGLPGAKVEPENVPALLGTLIRPQGLSPAASAGLAALLAGAAYYLLPWAKSGLGAFFTRVRGSDALEHPVRARLAAAIEAEPGLHLQELLRRTDTAAGQARHHLKVLEEHGLVNSCKSGGFLAFFPGRPTRAQRLRAGKVQGASARRVLAFIQAHPEASMQDIAAGTELSASTVSYHVQRLREAELVRATTDGRRTRLAVA